jgi:iron complex outermembrane recepter protein
VNFTPRSSCRALILACGLVASRRADGQEQPTTSDTATHRPRVQRLAPQQITGTRLAPADSAWSAATARVDVISAVERRRLAPGPDQAAKLLGRMNGVSSFDDQGARAQPTLDLRGWTLSPVVGVPQGVSVFLDGVRINEADAQEVNFDLIPSEAIASAELVRGPAAIYGKNTLAGAVLLTTQRGSHEPHVDAALSGGAFGFRQAHVLASGAPTVPLFGAVDALVLARASDESGYRVATPATTRMLFMNVGHHAIDASDPDIAITIQYAHDRLFQAGSLPESWVRADPRQNYTPGDFFAPDLVHLATRITQPLGSAALRGNVFVRRETSEQFNVNIDAPSSRAGVGATSLGSTLELDAPVPVGTRTVALTFGGEYSHDAVRYRVRAETTATAPALPGDCDPSGRCTSARVGGDNAGLFGQLVIPLVMSSTDADATAAPLALTLAARTDFVRVPLRDERDPTNDGTSTFRRLSPRVALAMHPSSSTNAYASLSAGFRTPAALELACADEAVPCVLPFALGDDPPLRPVSLVNYELGARWQPASWLTGDLSLYDSQVRNEIVFAASTRTAGYFRNVPRTSRRGAELSLSAERRRAGTTLRVTTQYSWVDARYGSIVQLASAIPDEPPVAPGDRFPLTPAHRLLATLGATTLRGAFIFDAELRVRGVSSQFLRGDEANVQPPLPACAVAAGHLGIRYARYTMAFDIENLLGSRFETFGTFAPDVLAPSTASGAAPIVRFLTPGYPRTLSLTLSAIW